MTTANNDTQPTMNKSAERFSFAIKARFPGLDIMQVGKAVGIEAEELEQILAGAISPSHDCALKLSKATGAPIQWLVQGHGPGASEYVHQLGDQINSTWLYVGHLPIQTRLHIRALTNALSSGGLSPTDLPINTH